MQGPAGPSATWTCPTGLRCPRRPTGGQSPLIESGRQRSQRCVNGWLEGALLGRLSGQRRSREPAPPPAAARPRVDGSSSIPASAKAHQHARLRRRTGLGSRPTPPRPELPAGNGAGRPGGRRRRPRSRGAHRGWTPRAPAPATWCPPSRRSDRTASAAIWRRRGAAAAPRGQVGPGRGRGSQIPLPQAPPRAPHGPRSAQLRIPQAEWGPEWGRPCSGWRLAVGRRAAGPPSNPVFSSVKGRIAPAEAWGGPGPW